MHAKIVSRLWVCLFFVGLVSSLSAQELGPGFHKIKDGIYTFAPDQSTTTCSFGVTEAGVVMIDGCNSRWTRVGWRRRSKK